MKKTEIEFPLSLAARGFYDATEHDDACGRAARKMPGGALLIVWVNYDDESRREFGRKFHVAIEPDSDSGMIDLASTDDEAKLLTFIDSIIGGAL